MVLYIVFSVTSLKAMAQWTTTGGCKIHLWVDVTNLNIPSLSNIPPADKLER